MSDDDTGSLWILNFDGLCENRNPGGTMAWGWTLLRPDTGELLTGGAYKAAEPGNTNNLAEYLALYAGLLKVAQLSADIPDTVFPGVLIRGDSQLVCYQVDNKWNVNHPRLQKAHAVCLKLLTEKIKAWQIQWVPREQNGAADELSRKAYHAATGHWPPERVRRQKAGPVSDVQE